MTSNQHTFMLQQFLVTIVIYLIT